MATFTRYGLQQLDSAASEIVDALHNYIAVRAPHRLIAVEELAEWEIVKVENIAEPG